MSDETPRLLPARRGFSIQFRDKYLLSTIDPIAQTERIFQSIEPQERSLYLLISPLLWYGVQAFLDTLPASSAILVLELEPELERLSRAECSRLGLDDARLHFPASQDASSLREYLQASIGLRKLRRIIPIRIGGAWTALRSQYEAVERALTAELNQHWSNAMTLSRMGRRYALNALRNLPLLARSAPLRASPRGALVCGAGPSLDATLDSLEALTETHARSERCFDIVCVDTALPTLLDRGIAPDLVVALESQHWNLRDFIGAYQQPLKLAMDLSALSATAEIFALPPLLFITRWTRLRFFERLSRAGLIPPEVPPLGSVGLSALYLACRLYRGPICVSGLDFAYDLDAFHARSTPSRIAAMMQQNRLQPLIRCEAAFRAGVEWVVGKEDRKLRSDPALKSYRELFEREFADQKRLFDLGRLGLELGLARLDVPKALELFQAAAAAATGREEGTAGAEAGEVDRQVVSAFIEREYAALEQLRALLSGTVPMNEAELLSLIDDCDYLWAHFPECAAGDGCHPPLSNQSFLNRVRAELNPAIKALGLARRELAER